MIGKIGWPHPILGLRRRIAWAAAWYRSARTTFEVVRLLDRETHLHSSRHSSRCHRPFVARTGFIV
ncbi:MAG TPA: hypothetical protein VEQ84_02890 [Vicinamibacteria bacterium]|nr:hypothetical protein [Vicinamibacteria bacterium]